MIASAIELWSDSIQSTIAAVLVVCLLPYTYPLLMRLHNAFLKKERIGAIALCRRVALAQKTDWQDLSFFVAGVFLALYCVFPPKSLNGVVWAYGLFRALHCVAVVRDWPIIRRVLRVLALGHATLLFLCAFLVLR